MPMKHLFAGERFQAFSDAIFAVVATIMVIPLKLTDEELDQQDFSLDTYLRDRNTLRAFGTYLYAFLLVVDAWYAHNRVFYLVEQVDDVVVWLNMLVLLFVSFLPAMIVMVRSFDNEPAAISTACVDIIIVGLLLCVILFYAFRQQDVLHTHLSRALHRTTLKWTMYIPLLVNPTLALLAIICSLGFEGTRAEPLGVVFFYMTGILGSIVRQIVWSVQKRRYKNRMTAEAMAFLMENNVSKERIAAFSDGIFSVVGTIILLDFSTVNIQEILDRPSVSTLESLIRDSRLVLLAYISSFFIVGLLWFVHHSMFQFFKTVTSLITLINTVSLCLVGLIPFAAQTVSMFSKERSDGSDDNECTAIRIMSLVLVLVGSFFILIWACAHFQKRHVLSVEVEDKASEGIMVSKLFVFPCIGLLGYFVTFSDGVGVHHFFTIMVFVTPILLMVPKLMYSVISYCHSKYYLRRHAVCPRAYHASSTFSTDGRFSRYKIQDDDEDKPLMQDEEEAGEEEEKEEGEEGEEEVFPPDHSRQASPANVPLKRQQHEPADPKKLVASGNGVV